VEHTRSLFRMLGDLVVPARWMGVTPTSGEEESLREMLIQSHLREWLEAHPGYDPEGQSCP
jgi:hypothetical protein